MQFEIYEYHDEELNSKAFGYNVTQDDQVISTSNGFTNEDIAEAEARLDIIARTNMADQLKELAATHLETEEMLEGIEQRQKLLAERKGRYERKLEKTKSIMQIVMERLDEQKFVEAEATFFLRKNADNIEIEDETKLPKEYFKPQPDKLDRTAVKDDVLKNGLILDGVRVYSGGKSLSVRRG